MATVITRYRLGLIHDHQPPGVPDLEAFATGPIPAPPRTVAAPDITPPMADNDKEGDCTIAGAVHIDQAGAKIVTAPWVYPGDPAVHTTYRELTGGPDTGLMLPQVLQPWHTTGLWGQRNGGYAVVHPHNTKAVKQTIAIFGNAYIAVNLPAVAQTQFNPAGTGVWKLTGTPGVDNTIEGGHCVVPCGYSPTGVVAITWGGFVLITWSWWMKYVVQVYAVVPPAFVAKGGDGRGYNLAAIDAWLPKV